MNKRAIRRIAKDSVYALLSANLRDPDDPEGDLYSVIVANEDWTEDEVEEFNDEVERIMRRIG
jgi:hypothetical protein